MSYSQILRHRHEEDDDENWYNHTSNTWSMWHKCYPEKGIETHHGMTGAQALPVLRKLREYMENNKEELLKLEPANGWGTYESALLFVSDLINASISNPKLTWYCSH